MPASSLTGWQRFSRRYLASIFFYPPAVLVVFWLLYVCFGTDYLYSVLLTPLLAPFIVVGELLVLAVFVFIPWQIVEDIVAQHRRHPWGRPLYHRYRERRRQQT